MFHCLQGFERSKGLFIIIIILYFIIIIIIIDIIIIIIVTNFLPCCAQVVKRTGLPLRPGKDSAVPQTDAAGHQPHRYLTWSSGQRRFRPLHDTQSETQSTGQIG